MDSSSCRKFVLPHLSHLSRLPRLFCVFRLPTCLLFALFCCVVPGWATELRLWDFPRWVEPDDQEDKFAWTNKQLRLFERSHPGVTVKLTKLSWARGQEKLKIAALCGRNPDVAPGMLPLHFIKQGLIAPIDPYLSAADRADYLPKAMQGFRFQGRHYGWPWYVSGQFLFANRALCASLGVELPADGRWTVAEFESVLSQLRHGMGEDSTRFPLGICFAAEETANMPFIHAFGGSWLDSSGNWQGSAKEQLQGLAWLQELRNNRLIPHDSGGRTPTDIWTAFGKEQRLALGVFGLWAVKAMSIASPPMDFTVLHFPVAEPEQENGPYLGISGYYVFNHSDPERVKLAMELARHLTDTPAQRRLERWPQFPTRRSAGNIYPGDRHMQRAWEILLTGRNNPALSQWGQIDEELETRIQSVLIGRDTPVAAMAKVDQAVSAILSRPDVSADQELRQTGLLGKLFFLFFPVCIFIAWKKRQIHLLMILPAATLLGIFLLYPVCEALALAFRDFNQGGFLSLTLDNFRESLADEKFVTACWNTTLYAAVVVPANVFTALLAASLIYALSGKWKSFFRAMYYLPGVASVVVISMVWRWIYNSEVGLFNTLLSWVGLAPVGWLTDPDVAFWSIILAGVLRSPGGAILIYLASLGNVPQSLYEQADLDGATPLQKWWHVTVPLLRSTTMFLLITGTIDALQVFAQVLMLTDGGPMGKTTVVVHRIYTSAFRDFNFGASSAMALLLFLAILVVTLLQRRLTGSLEYS